MGMYFAEFLCGRKCQNKRERERIENEARRIQLEQEAKMRDQAIAEGQLITEQQKALNQFQIGIQEGALAREIPSSSEEPETTSSYLWVWVLLLGIIVLGGGAWWYFKIRK